MNCCPSAHYQKKGEIEVRHVPTDEGRRLVEVLASCGVPHEEIGRIVGTSRRALGRHYRDQLAIGRVRANAKVAGNLFKLALGDGPGAVTACIFWLKCRAGWHQVPRDWLQVRRHEEFTTKL
jgi:hypothetical protein